MKKWIAPVLVRILHKQFPTMLIYESLLDSNAQNHTIKHKAEVEDVWSSFWLTLKNLRVTGKGHMAQTPCSWATALSDVADYTSTSRTKRAKQRTHHVVRHAWQSLIIKGWRGMLDCLSLHGHWKWEKHPIFPYLWVKPCLTVAGRWHRTFAPGT